MGSNKDKLYKRREKFIESWYYNLGLPAYSKVEMRQISRDRTKALKLCFSLKKLFQTVHTDTEIM